MRENDRGTGFRYCKRCALYDYHVCGADADHIVGGRTDCQYLPDGDFDSGADAYLCAKNSCSVCRDDDIWLMDIDESDGIHQQTLVGFLDISALG